MNRLCISFLRTASLGEVARFIVVGAISFIVDIGILITLQEIIFKTIAHGVLVAAAISFLVSLAIHYVLTALWVFRSHQIKTVKRHAKACAWFVVTNIVGLGINELVLFVGVSLMAIHYIPIKVFAAIVVMGWNFCCQKFFIFKPSQELREFV